MTRSLLHDLTRTRSGLLQFAVGAAINVAGAAVLLVHLAGLATAGD